MPKKLTATDLQRLHQTYADGLFRYFWVATGQQSDAEDLLQEFFVKLAKNQGSLAAVEHERAWIFAVARNLLIDWQKQAVRIRRNAAAPAEPPVDHPPDPDAAFFAQQMLSAMQSLPPEQRCVADLKLWEGLTLREIAESQQIPLQTAASRLRYALTHLRQRLQSLYSEIQ